MLVVVGTFKVLWMVDDGSAYNRRRSSPSATGKIVKKLLSPKLSLVKNEIAFCLFLSCASFM